MALVNVFFYFYIVELISLQ